MREQMMKDFRERWQAVAAIEAQEQRSATVALRWQQTNSILLMAIGLGLPLEETDESERLVHHRWAQLKGSRP